jgi:autotransporter translocation and assembly factor TamB
MKKRLRRARRWMRRLAIVAAAVVLLVVIAFVVAQTPWAKRRIAAYLERTLGELTGSEVSIGALRGTVPFSVSLQEARFTDKEGTWLRLSDTHVRWAPFALLRGRIRIHELHSSAIELTRIPRIRQREPRSARPWRETIPSLVVGTVVIDELTLGPALAGEETRLRLNGTVDARRPLESASTTWRIQRTDDPEAYANVAAVVRDEPATLSLRVDVHEPHGRVLGDLLGLDEAGAISASLNGEGPLTAWHGDLAATSHDYGELGARFVVELTAGPVSLEQSNPRAHGTLRLDLRHDGHTAQATAAFALQDGVLSASGLAAEGAGGELSGRIAVDVRNGLFDGELDGTVADVGALSALLGEEIGGSITLHASVHPAEGRQNAVVDAHAQNIDSRAGHVDDAVLHAQLSDLFGALRATATADAKGCRLADLSAETLTIEANGDLTAFSFTAHARGQYERPFELDADADVWPGERVEVQRLAGRYADIPIALRQPAAISQDGAEYSVSDVEFDVGSGSLVVSGRVGGEALAASARFEDMPLELLRSLGAPEVEGLASGLVEAHGTAAAPSLRAELTVENLRSLRAAYRDLAPATASVNAQLEGGELSGAVSLSQAEGTTALDARFRLPVTLSLSPVALVVPSDGALEATLSADAHVDLLSALLLPPRYELHGQIETRIEAGGTMAAPKIAGTLHLSNGRWTDTTTQTAVEDLAAAASFTLGDGTLRLAECSVSARGGALTAEGHVALGDRPWQASLDEPFEAKVSAHADLAELARLLAFDAQSISGRVAVDLSAAGTLETPRLTGSLRLEKAAYAHGALGNVADALDAQADIALNNGVLAVSGFSATSAAGSVTGQLRMGVGAWPWTPAPDGLLEAKLTGTMRLDPFAALLLPDDQSLTGRIEADVEIAGTRAAPVVGGWLRLRDGAYENLRTGTVLSDIAADVEPTRSRLVLKELRASDGQKGTLSASGWLDIAPDEHFPFKIELAIADATLVRADYVTGAMKGNVTLSGSTNDILLAGRITTGATEVQLPERAAPELVELNVIEINVPDGAAAAPAPARPMRPIRLDLTIGLPKRVSVRGHGLDSEWEGKLSVAGDSAAPVITGRLKLVRGWFDFADRHFKLSDGITAVIQLAGPVTAPSVTISSTPALPSDEVLARVLFGGSVSSLTPYQALRLAEIMDTLARGGNGFSLLGSVRRIMNVDRLELTEADGTSGPAVSAGKYLSDDLYVEVKQGVTDATTTVSVEKQISHSLSVESDIGTHHGPGIGIKLHWDY